jgi:hypothetical protein
MENGRMLGQIGRFTQLEPVIRRTFDIPSHRPAYGLIKGRLLLHVLADFVD